MSKNTVKNNRIRNNNSYIGEISPKEIRLLRKGKGHALHVKKNWHDVNTIKYVKLLKKRKPSKDKIPVPEKRININPIDLNPYMIEFKLNRSNKRFEKDQLCKENILKKYEKREDGLNCKQRRNLKKYGNTSYCKYRIELKISQKPEQG